MWGVIGLGNVGLGTLQILAENGDSIREKLGFPLRVKSVCSRNVKQKNVPAFSQPVARTDDWREIVSDPEIDIVVEVIGGTATASQIIEQSLKQHKSVVTANKELMALRGAEYWDIAIQNGVNLAMEASVAGGIPIHTILREGIAGDRVTELYGILNGTCNYILTEIEKSSANFESVLAEAQQLGYAEADPSADVDGLDARSKLAILAALAYGERLTPADIYTEGIRRVMPVDFEYAHQLKHTIRLVCMARQSEAGLSLIGAAHFDSAIRHSGAGAGRLQRRLGARKVWRRHFLLRTRRGRETDRGGSGERLDARGPRDSLRQPGACEPVCARAAGTVQADASRHAAAAIFHSLPGGR